MKTSTILFLAAGIAVGVLLGILTLSQFQEQRLYGTPEGVAKAFLEAMGEDDYDGAKKYADDETKKVLDTFKAMGSSADPSPRFGLVASEIDCTENGTKAFCRICCGSDGQSGEINLMQDDQGHWKVSMTKEKLSKEI